MGYAWQLQEAKNKLSEVIDKALKKGPQEITRHGRKTAVVLSFKEYQKLKKRKGSTLTEFFHNSPLQNIELTRPEDYGRSVEL